MSKTLNKLQYRWWSDVTTPRSMGNGWVWECCCKPSTLQSLLWKRHKVWLGFGNGNLIDRCQQASLWSLLMVLVIVGKIFFPIQGLLPPFSLSAKSPRSVFNIISLFCAENRAVHIFTIILGLKCFPTSTPTSCSFQEVTGTVGVSEKNH